MKINNSNLLVSLTVSVPRVVSAVPSHSFNSQEVPEGKGPSEIVASALVIGFQKASDTEKVSSSIMDTAGWTVNLISRSVTTIALL